MCSKALSQLVSWNRLHNGLHGKCMFCVQSERRSICCDSIRKLSVECSASDNGFELPAAPDSARGSTGLVRLSTVYSLTPLPVIISHIWGSVGGFIRKKTTARKQCGDLLRASPPVSGCMENVSSILQLLDGNLQH